MRTQRKRWWRFSATSVKTAHPDSRVAHYTEKRLMEATGKAKRSLQIARGHATERGLLDDVDEAKRQLSSRGFRMQAPLVRVAHDAMPLYRCGVLREWLAGRKLAPYRALLDSNLSDAGGGATPATPPAMA